MNVLTPRILFVVSMCVAYSSSAAAQGPKCVGAPEAVKWERGAIRSVDGRPLFPLTLWRGSAKCMKWSTLEASEAALAFDSNRQIARLGWYAAIVSMPVAGLARHQGWIKGDRRALTFGIGGMVAGVLISETSWRRAKRSLTNAIRLHNANTSGRDDSAPADRQDGARATERLMESRPIESNRAGLSIAISRLSPQQDRSGSLVRR